MRHLMKLFFLTLAGGSAFAACDQATGPTAPPGEVRTSHQSVETTGTAGIYRLDTQGIPVEHVADVMIVDDGNSLTVTGTAVNVPEEGGRFLSLFYGKGSRPYSTTACLPAPNARKQLTQAQMFIDFWSTGTPADGELVLSAVMTGDSYVPLSEIETISVRDVQNSGAISIQPSLIGCGKVRVHP